MPAPSTSLSTLRPDLSGSLMEFDLAMDRQGFVGYRALPVLDVMKSSGSFGKIPIEQLLQQRDTNRAPGAGYSRGKFTFTKDTFATEEHGAEEPIDDRQAELYAEYFDAELISTERARDAVLRNAEKRVADLLFNTGTWTGSSLSTAAAVPWSTAATAAPITDVDNARQKVWNGSGIWPNCLIINRRNFHLLRMTAQVIDAVASQGAGNAAKARDITIALLASVFDLDYILVAGSAKNTAIEGQAAAVSQIWSNSLAMVCKIATTNDIQEPCIGRTMHWAQDGSQINGQVETYRDETVRGDVVRVRHDVDEKVLYTELGHLLTSVSS